MSSPRKYVMFLPGVHCFRLRRATSRAMCARAGPRGARAFNWNPLAWHRYRAIRTTVKRFRTDLSSLLAFVTLRATPSGTAPTVTPRYCSAGLTARPGASTTSPQIVARLTSSAPPTVRSRRLCTATRHHSRTHSRTPFPAECHPILLHAPCNTLYQALMLTIRCHDQFTSSGWRDSTRWQRGPLSRIAARWTLRRASRPQPTANSGARLQS